MREVDGGTFLNEPNIGRIAEALRRIFNEGVAKECGTVLTGVTPAKRKPGDPHFSLTVASAARESA